MDSIVEAVFTHPAEQPDRSALLFAEQTMTYGQL